MSSIVRTPQQLGNVIRRARKLRGLSQGELAARTGLRQATISQIEAGAVAKLETLLAVLAALDLEFRIVPRTSLSIDVIADDL